MAKKISVYFIIVLCAGIMISALFSIGLMRNYYISGLEDRLVSSGKLVSKMFQQSYSPLKSDYNALAKEYSSITGTRVTIIASSGKVMGESNFDSSSMDNHLAREEVSEALSGRIGRSFRYSSTEHIQMLYVAVPANYGSSAAVIRLAVPLKDVQEINNNIVKYTLFSFLAGLFGASIIAVIFVKNITKPVNAMTHTASMIASGKYEKRIDIKSKDEIGKLSETFNYMAEKLETTIHDLSDKKSKLEAILKSIQSGVIAIDSFERVMLVNPAAKDIFGFENDIVGRHILEVSRNVEFEEILTGGEERQKEITLSFPEKRIVRVNVAPIKDVESSDSTGSGMVAVIQDVTELKALEKIRTDFVANVSHELKTPLTSIKGFTETLKNGAINDTEARDKFLDIISVEADRLTRLINDILTLSELENKKQNIKFERLDINSIVSEIKCMMQGLAQTKKIDLNINLSGEHLFVMGSSDKVKQLLINLVDNAIKYTHEGGRVSINTSIIKDMVAIEVVDTGIGIPREHIHRLFERFYRVDKGRSRSLGGTGLGLAIVKHITSGMNGEIKVKSQVGKGSVFTVLIPILRNPV